MSLFLRLAVSATIAPAPAAAQAGSNFLGTWVLDSARSTFDPAPGPRSLTVVITNAPGGYTITATGIAADGRTFGTSYTATYDGRDAPVRGAGDYDAVAVTLIDANTRHTIRKKQGKTVQTMHSVVSEDGRQLTTTIRGVNAAGGKVESVQVYDRR